MKKIIALSTLVFLSGCSTSPSHVGTPSKTAEGNEYSIQDTPHGFIVAGHYSEYQFVRNSQDAFMGCAELINNTAETYSKDKGTLVGAPRWDEVDIIDHGRDIITAIMNVNCRYEYRYAVPTTKELETTDELKELAELYKQGLLTESEFKVAKAKVLAK